MFACFANNPALCHLHIFRLDLHVWSIVSIGMNICFIRKSELSNQILGGSFVPVTRTNCFCTLRSVFVRYAVYCMWYTAILCSVDLSCTMRC